MRTAYRPALAGDVAVLVPEGTDRPPRVPPDIFAAAHECFRAGQRLDMQAMARGLRVGRATLYRRAGNRELLLDEVVWWRTRHALVAGAHASIGLTGVPRILAVVAGLMHAVEQDRSLRAFLETDPEVALRILTGKRSTVQRGVASTFERVIDLETGRGNFATELDTSTLAYAVVRLGEGFLYSDVVADRAPDIERAITVIEGLLRGLDTNARV